MWSSLQQNYEAVFKPLKPLISKELAVFLFHGRVFSQGVFILFVALSSEFSCQRIS